eukprot:gnl/TRDRNA2_/TRDRNA2_176007_c0_seq1.p1 gnl/TRDRNA2_/TRDRNA2_176007_c0~~gnl/TRDRNA2_/TRDRNA2_176007_c0_seq1.p1  ORF type:complete len:442 (-),score=48.49 gnl/TRDRNA2_/TRDRNA2_176007_c0_seq1:464-1789(-)
MEAVVAGVALMKQDTLPTLTPPFPSPRPAIRRTASLPSVLSGTGYMDGLVPKIVIHNITKSCPVSSMKDAQDEDLTEPASSCCTPQRSLSASKRSPSVHGHMSSQGQHSLTPPLAHHRPASRCSHTKGRQSKTPSRPVSADSTAATNTPSTSRCTSSIRSTAGSASGAGIHTSTVVVRAAHKLKKLQEVSKNRTRSISSEPPRSRAQIREDNQLDALKSLVKSTMGDRKLGELIKVLLRHVVKHSGTGAFTEDQISRAVEEVLSVEQTMGSDKQGHLHMYSHVVSVLRILAECSQMCLSDILGQILAHQRGNLKHSQHRKIADDMSWVGAESRGDDIFAGPLDEVFEQLSSKGRMRFRKWQEAIHLVEKNPVLRSRVKPHVADIIFWGETHRGADVRADIDRWEFQHLLLKLADAMDVHPSMVFMAVGCHAGSITPDKDEE